MILTALSDTYVLHLSKHGTASERKAARDELVKRGGYSTKQLVENAKATRRLARDRT